MSSINSSWVKDKNKKRIYAIAHAKSTIRGRSTVDRDLTSLEGRTSAMEEIIEERLIVNGNVPVILGRSEAAGEVEITNEGWKFEDNLYYLDIENESITANTIAIVSVSPDSYEIAESCLLKAYCRTSDGVLRIYAGSPPAAPIIASIALVGDTLSSGDGVKLNKGTGTLSIDRDVVVTDDDLVDETDTLDIIRDSLNN